MTDHHERLRIDPVGIAIVLAMLLGVALVFGYEWCVR